MVHQAHPRRGKAALPPLPLTSRLPITRFGHLHCSKPCRHSSYARSQMSKVCVPGGQVPLRTLVRVSDLRIFTIIDDFARLEPPHGRAQPELNPHALPFRLSAAEHLAQSSATDLLTGQYPWPSPAELRTRISPEPSDRRGLPDLFDASVARVPRSPRHPVQRASFRPD